MSVFVIIAMLLLSPLVGQAYGAPDKANQVAESVKIKVWTVLATNGHATIDPDLKPIAKHLGNLKFSGFDLLSKQGASIDVKGENRFKLVGQRSVLVTVLSRDKDRARVRVQVVGPKGKLLDTTVSIRRNGFFMVAGPPHAGGVLVLPIFARY
jgi:hypothetical protein